MALQNYYFFLTPAKISTGQWPNLKNHKALKMNELQRRKSATTVQALFFATFLPFFYDLHIFQFGELNIFYIEVLEVSEVWLILTQITANQHQLTHKLLFILTAAAQGETITLEIITD